MWEGCEPFVAEEELWFVRVMTKGSCLPEEGPRASPSLLDSELGPVICFGTPEA